jgi:hypothetical protein
MGKKIIVNLAAVAKKGLETVAANELSRFSNDKNNRVFHPENIIHAMVQPAIDCSHIVSVEHVVSHYRFLILFEKRTNGKANCLHIYHSPIFEIKQ